ITSDLVHLMTDEELSNYLPVHGDRLRLRKHIKQESSATEKKKKLFGILKEKLDASTSKKEEPSYEADKGENMRRQFGNKNAYKGSRYIELGWIHRFPNRSKQVRTRTGGGTRKVPMRKDSTKAEILAEAKRLFFPNGQSKKGKITDFDIDLWDFSEGIVKESMTLQEMYDDTKIPLLRFYLASTPKSGGLSFPSEPMKDVLARAMEISEISENSELTECEPDTRPVNVVQDPVINSLPNFRPRTDQVPGRKPPNNQPGHQTELENKQNYLEIPDFMAHTISNLYPDSVDVHVLPNLRDISENDFSEQMVVKEMTIRVHRGQVLKDMIAAFAELELKNVILSFEMVMPNGNVEIAEDGGGVTRDTLSEFWNTFYDQCTLGTEAKVPCLRHDFGEREWTAIGKILLFGWEAQKYLPVNMARPFIEQCLYGKNFSSLQEAFYQYIPPSETITLKTAMDSFEDADYDEILDVMVLHDSRKVPTRDTLPQLIEEMAHKELIQAPMFVCDCFQPILKNMIGESELAEAYSRLTPTGRSVSRILSFPENMTADEIGTSNHLKRFIKELTSDKLKRFLRFCTGSDLLAVEKITVNFVNVAGFARRPVAHTCTCMLELSKVFDSFPQFRSEFNSVLESNYWEMDFI
ncbi:hypothetical protein FSP39_002703, partial [Pinctada imbricata]